MPPISREILRIIDANLDRIGEGLRVLEDVARFALNEPALSQELKDLRHQVVHPDWALQRSLLQARDSSGDVGRDLESSDQKTPQDLAGTVVANARRVQEGLRVIEELARIPGFGVDPDTPKQARFKLYALEKDLVSRLLRQEKVRNIRGLYVIIDLTGPAALETAEKVVRGGASAVELRPVAGGSRHDLQRITAIKETCVAHGAALLVHERLDLALAAGADGLTLGQEGLPMEKVRRLVPLDHLIGLYASQPEEARNARLDGADFLLVNEPGCNLATMRTAGLPLIGVISAGESIRTLAEFGAEAMAVHASEMDGPGIERRVRDLVNKLEDRNDE